jgi:hypothetical protein
MKNHAKVNALLETRQPCTSFEDNTYYNISLFEHFCDHRDYKYVAIFGYYKNKYDWSDAQAQEMYAKSPDGWHDGVGVYRLYDWGRGLNEIVKGEDRDWHKPQLDHIVPRSKGGPNTPDNFQVVPSIVNRVMTDLTDETAQAILPILQDQFKTYPPISVAIVKELINEVDVEDPIDWGMLNIDESGATDLIANNVVDMYNRDWQHLSDREFRMAMLATVGKLVLENFVLNIKLAKND